MQVKICQHAPGNLRCHQTCDILLTWITVFGSEILEQLFWFVFALAVAPIVIGFLLRQIAGKHAPAYYETETDEETEERQKRQAKRRDDDHQDNWWR